MNTPTNPIESEYYELFGTLHGLVCLYDYTKLVLWNPSLRKSSNFPFPCDFTVNSDYGGVHYVLVNPTWMECDSHKKDCEMEALQRRSTCNRWRSGLRVGNTFLPNHLNESCWNGLVYVRRRSCSALKSYVYFDL